MKPSEAKAFIKKMHDWEHKGKPRSQWSMEDYMSYFHEVFRTGTVLTDEMIYIMSTFHMSCYLQIQDLQMNKLLDRD